MIENIYVLDYPYDLLEIEKNPSKKKKLNKENYGRIVMKPINNICIKIWKEINMLVYNTTQG